ncbi:MAG: adenylate cyclase [Clostridiales bacterium]|nr:adenylate cyclase [Clostridiales bacterium]
MEIERKWLLSKEKIPYKLSLLKKEEIEQAYISFSPVIRVRSVDSKRFILTVKGFKSDDSLAREENEIEITAAQYASLLKKSEGVIIRKTRYYHQREDFLIEEIDIFHGDYEGLAYLEIEFGSVEDAVKFKQPEWVKQDVTNIRCYGNGSLAENRLSVDELNKGDV